MTQSTPTITLGSSNTLIFGTRLWSQATFQLLVGKKTRGKISTSHDQSTFLFFLNKNFHCSGLQKGSHPRPLFLFQAHSLHLGQFKQRPAVDSSLLGPSAVSNARYVQLGLCRQGTHRAEGCFGAAGRGGASHCTLVTASWMEVAT